MKRQFNKSEIHIKGEGICSLDYKKCYEKKVCMNCIKCKEYKLNKGKNE